MVSAFLFDSATYQILATGDWSSIQKRALRMLAAFRRHGRLDKARGVHMVYLYFKHPWNEKLRNPEALRAWVSAERDPEDALPFPITDLNPHGLSVAPIPSGVYCYSSLGPMRKGKDGKPFWRPKHCKYLRGRTFGGVRVAWCDFLRRGSIPNGTTNRQYLALKRHFGSQKAMEDKLPLFLLWDSCKECGIKNAEEDV